MKLYLHILFSLFSLACCQPCSAQIPSLVQNFGAKLANQVAPPQFHAGVFGSSKCYYMLGQQIAVANANIGASMAITNGQFRGCPWSSQFGGTIDELVIATWSTGLNTNGDPATVRVGIYETTSQSNMYPQRLVWTTNVVCTNGYIYVPCSIVIRANKVYWNMVHTDGTNAVFGSTTSASGMLPLLGRTNPEGSGLGTVAVTWSNVFQAMPLIFPAQTNNMQFETSMNRTPQLMAHFK